MTLSHVMFVVMMSNALECCVPFNFFSFNSQTFKDMNFYRVDTEYVKRDWKLTFNKLVCQHSLSSRTRQKSSAYVVQILMLSEKLR